MQPAGAPSHYEPSAEGQSPASISLSIGVPFNSCRMSWIAPVEIYKPPCGAMQVAPQGGFIVRMGMAVFPTQSLPRVGKVVSGASRIGY